MKNIWGFIAIIGWLCAIDGANITIYNSGNSFVQEERTMYQNNVHNNILRFEDLPANILEDHIHIQSIGFDILTKELQRYSISENEFLKQHLEKIIHLVGYDSNGKVSETTKGRLISLKNGRLFEIDGQYVFNPPLTPLFDTKNIQLDSAPTLKCEIENSNFPSDAKLSYFVSGLKWVAEYDLAIDSAGVGAISAWYVLTNSSATPFENATISLLAGDVRQPLSASPKSTNRLLESASLSGGFSVSTTDYTMFNIPQKVDLRDNSTKRSVFFNVENIPVSREYYVKHSLGYRPQSSKTSIPVQIRYGLGSSEIGVYHIPAGNVNVIENNTFVGSVNIPLTQKGEKIYLQTGSTLDISSKVVVESYEVGRRENKVDVVVQINNTRDETTILQWVEQFSGEWEIKNPSVPFKKQNSSEAVFDIELPKNSEFSLSFSVHIKRN